MPAPKRSRYSYSSPTSYHACPAAWKQTYLDEDPGVVPDRVRNGAMAHDGIARMAQACWPERRDVDAVAGWAIADSYPEPVRSLLLEFQEKWRWTWGDTVGDGQQAPVEQEFAAPLPSGRQFTGHIDLLRCFEDAAQDRRDYDPSGDGHLWVVTDFKNRSYHAEECSLGNDEMVPLQHLVYAWLTQQVYPEAKNFELRVYLLAGYEAGPWQVSGNLDWVGELLDARAEVLDRDREWEPRPGPACAGCFHAMTCPLKENQTWHETALKTAEMHLVYLMWLQAQVAAETAYLRDVAQATGPVDIDGWRYDGEQSSSLVLKPGAGQTLDDMGIYDADLRGPHSKTKIVAVGNKLFKRDPLLADEFWQCWEKKPGAVVYKPRRRDGQAGAEEDPAE